MRIDLNGAAIDISACTLAEALADLGYGGALATALNGRFVPATARTETPLRDASAGEAWGASMPA